MPKGKFQRLLLQAEVQIKNKTKKKKQKKCFRYGTHGNASNGTFMLFPL
jgi:hypothetical protein